MGLLTKKPSGIQCVDWEPDPDQKPTLQSRRCKYYIKGGTCQLPKRFICEEWERANPTIAADLINEGRLAHQNTHSPALSAGSKDETTHLSTSPSPALSAASGQSGQSDCERQFTSPNGTQGASGKVEKVGIAHQEPYRYFPYDADPPPITEQTLKELERYGTTWLITEPDGKVWFVAPTHNVTPPVPVHQTITYRELALLAAIRVTFPGSKFERGGK